MGMDIVKEKTMKVKTKVRCGTRVCGGGGYPPYPPGGSIP
jgi:hypothetical protein